MDVLATTMQTLLELPAILGEKAQEKPLVAFGIAQVKKPEVELSAQGKILQQVEQAQKIRQQSLPQPTQNDESQQADTTNNYIRVSSSIGSAQKNNLSGDEVTKVYRAIEKLL